MSTEKAKMDIGFGEMDGEYVNVKEADFPVVIAQLEDGTKISFKQKPVKAFRASDKFDDKGNPFYAFQFAVEILSFEVPEELKRKKE